MPAILVVDPEKCTSCRLCELACSQHSGGVFRPSRARIRIAIRSEEAFYFPMICLQCDDAPCMLACSVDALVRDPTTNAVVLIEERCNECGICGAACSYGAIDFVEDKPRKCDLCGGDPECVRFCAAGALRFETPEHWPEAQRQAYADRLENLVEEGKV